MNIKQLTLRNFKGTRHLVVDLGNKNQIIGDNRTGKTTVADAYSWVLFGKNSKNETEFDIKTLDPNNQPIPKLQHEVELILEDGTKLRKVYSEKWTTRRGESEEQLTGHTTDYFINDVPKSKSEYEAKVESIIKSDVARLISDTKYFNEVLKWNDRREIISSLVDNSTPNQINENSENDLSEIVSMINLGKDIEEEKKRVQAQKKIVKDEAKLIPSKIEEVNRMMPEPLDYVSIEKELEGKQGQLSSVEKSINDVSAEYQEQANANAELIKTKATKEREYSELETQLRNTPNTELDAYYEKLNALTSERSSIGNELATKRSEAGRLEITIENAEKDLKQLRQEWNTMNCEVFTFDPSKKVCPTCNREHENAVELEEQFRANFNTQKQLRIEENESKGSDKAAEKMNSVNALEALNKEIETLAKQFTAKENEIDTHKSNVPTTRELQPTLEMVALKAEIDSIVIPEIMKKDVSDLEQQKRELNEQIDELKKQLGTKEQREKLEARIKELNEQAKAMAQQIADLEKLEFLIEAYQNSEMDLVEKKVNDKFAITKFKMFDVQMNGGIAQTCVAMVNGVPYRSVNTADQIKCSLDIINTIQHHYGVFAPVFIDNRESITELPAMNCQTIELIVKAGQKNLEIVCLD